MKRLDMMIGALGLCCGLVGWGCQKASPPKGASAPATRTTVEKRTREKPSAEKPPAAETPPAVSPAESVNEPAPVEIGPVDTPVAKSPAESVPGESRDKLDDAPKPANAAKPAAAPSVEIRVGEPTASSPVSAGAAIDPVRVKAGEKVTVYLRVKTAENWHIYAADQPTGVGIPTKLEVQLPASLTADGQWVYPEAKAYPSAEPCFIYEGDVMFRLALNVLADAPPGSTQVKCLFAYQACNDQLCLPPKKVDLKVDLEIVPN